MTLRQLNTPTRRARDRMWIGAVIMIAGLYVLKLFQALPLTEPKQFASAGIASDEVSFWSANRAVGEGYYPELAKAFLAGHLYFDRPLNPALLTEANPYGMAAAKKGILIQDASLFQGRYYLYFGAAPVAAFYLPVHALTGRFPSDALAVFALGCCYAVIVGLLLGSVLGPRNWGFLPAFCLLVANPVMVKSLSSVHNVHGISRMCAAVCVLASWYCLRLLLKRISSGDDDRLRADKRLYGMTGLASFFISFAIATRVTAFVDLACTAVLFASLLWVFRARLGRHVPRLALLYAMPVMATVAMLGLYNFARFADAFEFGQRFQTNGQDFIHGGSPLRPPAHVAAFAGHVAYRTYEYFLALPVVTPTSLEVRYWTRSPFIDGAFSEGAIGLVTWAPAILFLPSGLWRAFAERSKGKSRVTLDTVFLGVSFVQFSASFLLVAMLTLTAFHYSLDFVPRLALVVTALLAMRPSEFSVEESTPVRSIAQVATVVLSVLGLVSNHLI